MVDTQGSSKNAINIDGAQETLRNQIMRTARPEHGQGSLKDTLKKHSSLMTPERSVSVEKISETKGVWEQAKAEVTQTFNEASRHLNDINTGLTPERFSGAMNKDSKVYQDSINAQIHAMHDIVEQARNNQAQGNLLKIAQEQGVAAAMQQSNGGQEAVQENVAVKTETLRRLNEGR